MYKIFLVKPNGEEQVIRYTDDFDEAIKWVRDMNKNVKGNLHVELVEQNYDVDEILSYEVL